jgi:hypothetical protein
MLKKKKEKEEKKDVKGKILLLLTIFSVKFLPKNCKLLFT